MQAKVMRRMFCILLGFGCVNLFDIVLRAVFDHENNCKDEACEQE